LRREEAVRLAERLGAASPRVLELPVKSRYPSRLSRRLRFDRCAIGYCLVVCRGLSCILCLAPEEPVLRIMRVPQRDVLSDLVHAVPVVRVECCGRIIATGEWRGSLIVIDGFDCPCIIDKSRIECWSSDYALRVSEAVRGVL